MKAYKWIVIIFRILRVAISNILVAIMIMKLQKTINGNSGKINQPRYFTLTLLGILTEIFPSVQKHDIF